MRTSEAYDSIYTKRPGWSVGRHDTTSDVLSPNLPTKGLKRPIRQSIFLATSIVVGAILVAFFISSSLAAHADIIAQSKDTHSNSAAVTINGKSAPLPKDGSMHTTYGSNKSTVDIRIQSSSTAD